MNQNIEQKVTDIIINPLELLGFELVKVSLGGHNSRVLEILIDRLDQEKVSISDCQLVSRNISALLDVEEVILDKYYLEVASCGIERPLTKMNDFSKFIGQEAKIKLKELMNGCGNYQGKIIKVENENIQIEVNSEIISIPFELVKKARLVFTEEMFRIALNKEEKK